MYILIPVSSNEGIHSKIATLVEMKTWALVEFEDGKAKQIEFNDDRIAFATDWIDFVVFENKFESYIDFMNEGMMCLAVREEETIEEIMSAFAFKELDEMGL